MIQRLIILHLNIHEWSFQCTDDTRELLTTPAAVTTGLEENEDNDGDHHHHHHYPQHYHSFYNAENASEDELQIPILYYYDVNSRSSNNTVSQPQQQSQQQRRQRIQFAGLCQALYQLPTTLHSITTTSNHMNHNENTTSATTAILRDRTKVVQYDSNTALVFVPLTTTESTSDDINRDANHSPKHFKKQIEIVAVAQILTSSLLISNSLLPLSSASNRLINMETPHPAIFSSSTPTAVYHALQRTYDQFCLLRQGTIHERLLQSPPPSPSPNDRNQMSRHSTSRHDYYPGMEQLYLFYQQQQQHRQSSSVPSEAAITTSPIPMIKMAESYTKLCHDLQHHFDDFLMIQNYNTDTSNGGGYRHVTECFDRYQIPTVSTDMNATIKQSQSSSLPYEELQEQLPGAIHRHMTMKTASPTTDTPHVIGVSIFRSDQLMMLHTDSLDRSSLMGTALLQHNIHTSSDGTTITVLPNECAILLFQYMKQIQLRMIQQQQQQLLDRDNSILPATTKMTTSPSIQKSSSFTKLFRPFALSFLKDDCIVSSTIQSSPNIKKTATTTTTTAPQHSVPSSVITGTFLSPPPFSLLSVLDDDQSTSFVFQEDDVEEDSNLSTVYVWAPSVALPLTTYNPDSEMELPPHKKDDERTTVHARMCLYLRNDIQCLIYLSQPQYHDNDDSHNSEPNQRHRLYQLLFHEISNQIEMAISELTEQMRDNENPNDDELLQNCSSSTTTSWDIQYSTTPHLPLPRPGLDLLIIDRMEHTISIHIDESGTGTNPPNNTGTTTNYKHNGDHRHSESLLLSNKNDVRSLLVKHLSPDAVLALDDAMEEVQLRTAATTTRIGTNPQQQPSFESCTLLQHQWVYACSLKHVEFYMLFHTTHFVTISDVQQEAQHIRKTYFSK